jgi:hypothetical protein
MVLSGTPEQVPKRQAQTRSFQKPPRPKQVPYPVGRRRKVSWLPCACLPVAPDNRDVLVRPKELDRLFVTARIDDKPVVVDLQQRVEIVSIQRKLEGLGEIEIEFTFPEGVVRSTITRCCFSAASLLAVSAFELSTRIIFCDWTQYVSMLSTVSWRDS